MENKEKDNKIDYRFKILYALAIIAVVQSHSSIAGLNFFYDWFPPYSMHLALFVFIPGYFYKTKNEEHPLQYIFKKVKKLLVPLFLWSAFYGLLAFVLSFFGATLSNTDNLLFKVFIDPMYTGHQLAYNLATWFVFPLFTVEVFNILFRKVLFFIKNSKLKDIICFIVYLILGSLAVYFANIGYKNGIYLPIGKCLTFLPIFGLGVMYKSILEKYADKISSIIYFPIIFALQLFLIIKYGMVPSYCHPWLEGYGFYPVVFLTYVLSISFWLRMAKIFEPALGKNKIINTIADNTFSIMANHILAFMMVKLVCSYMPMCNSFSMSEFKNNVFYIYLPGNSPYFAIVYVAAGIIIPIAMQYGITYIYKFIKNNLPKIKSLKEAKT